MMFPYCLWVALGGCRPAGDGGGTIAAAAVVAAALALSAASL